MYTLYYSEWKITLSENIRKLTDVKWHNIIRIYNREDNTPVANGELIWISILETQRSILQSSSNIILSTHKPIYWRIIDSIILPIYRYFTQ